MNSTLTTKTKKALRAEASKQRVAKYRRKNHLRADGWVEPGTRRVLSDSEPVYIDRRLEVAERLVKAAIRRMEFPSNGGGWALTHSTRTEAMQAGMVAASMAGFFDHGFVSLGLCRDIRSAIRGRKCLRMQCQQLIYSDKIETIANETNYATDYEDYAPCLTTRQRDTARRVMAYLRVARDISPSQKRQTAFVGHRNFFLEVLGHVTGRGGRLRSGKSFSTRASRFVEYLDNGWKAAPALHSPAYSPSLDILAFWSTREMAA